ncbi:hypothetical protein [Streptomyces huasconensis]
MNSQFLAAPGGGPDWPVWGQILFVTIWLVLAVFIVGGLVRRRRRQR